jgi:hypothetical protein
MDIVLPKWSVSRFAYVENGEYKPYHVITGIFPTESIDYVVKEVYYVYEKKEWTILTQDNKLLTCKYENYANQTPDDPDECDKITAEFCAK